jgi:sporulation protein YunB
MRFFLLSKYKKWGYFLIILIIIFLTIVMLKIYNTRIDEPLNKYSYSVVNKYVYELVSSYFHNELINEKDWNKVLHITKNNDGEILLVDFDLKEANRLNEQITKMLETNINNISLDLSMLPTTNRQNNQKGLKLEIPFFLFTNWPLLVNLGPKIPIKVELIGSIKTNVKTSVNDYGLNNSLVEIYVTTTTNINILTPVNSKEYILDYNILLDSKLIQGRVPYLYGGTLLEEKQVFN